MPEFEEQLEQDKAVMELLRQLSSGLSVFRLFPGDPEQATFVAAVDRVKSAAEAAISYGAVVVEVRGETFRTPNGELPPDQMLSRLALACYDRQIEMMRVRGVPTPQELLALYEVLTTPVNELETSDDIGIDLQDKGVFNIALGKVEPIGVQGPSPSDSIDQFLAAEEEIWQRLEDRERLAEGRGDAGREAEEMYRRFKDLVDSLPRELSDDPELYRKLKDTVAEVPQSVRQELATKLLERFDEDPLAERLIGTMTDADLARTLSDMGGGPKDVDPVALARNLTSNRLRRDDLVGLTQAIVNGQQEAGTIIPPMSTGAVPGVLLPPRDARLPPPPVTDGGRHIPHPDEEMIQQSVFETMSDVLGKELLDREDEDAKSIRDEFPRELGHIFEEALRTFEDYLGVEDDVERLEQVLETFVEIVRNTFLQRNAPLLAGLMDAFYGAQARGAGRDPKRDEMLADAHAEMIDAEMVAPLLEGGPAAHDAAVGLLAPMGGAAVQILFDILTTEETRGGRAALVSLLSSLARGHYDIVADRLSDPLWYLVRNAVTILRQSGAGPTEVPLIQRAAENPHPAVRREAVRALVTAAGPEAVLPLRRLTNDRDESVRNIAVQSLGGIETRPSVNTLADIVQNSRDLALRRRALDELARLRLPEANEALQRLAAWNQRPRLPRSLRKQARTLARRKRESR